MFWQPSPKIWCSSVTIKELYPALGDAPSFTDFSPEIDRNYENESPGTFQTLSFGTDVSQISAVRFAEEYGKKKSMRGRNALSPGFRNSFGH